MKAAESLIAWTPGSPQEVHVGPWPARQGDESSRYLHWFPAIGRFRSRERPMEKAEVHDFLLRTFRYLVVEEGMDARALNAELLKLDEWREVVDEEGRS